MAGSPASPGLQLSECRAFRTSRWDIVMIALAAVHAAVLLATPTALVIALCLWWNSNTISHNFIHRPFFRRRAANRLFAAYLSVLLGFPQSLWRDRHLAHHAGIHRPPRLSAELGLQVVLVLSLWIAIATRAPRFFLSVYLPGYVAGLGLCALHGYYEHARGTTSHYGRLYNLLLFNDGYHVEHHAHPGLHWAHLPECHEPSARASVWPAPLRWMEVFSLETLERLVLRSCTLQHFMLRTHDCAFRGLIGALPPVECVGIVGGGLFPRTALILLELLPAARLTIIDSNRANLDRARLLLGVRSINYVHTHYTKSDTGPYDLLVFPLSLPGAAPASMRAHRHQRSSFMIGSGANAVSAVSFR
jgi:Fatty acid desaturase